MASVDSGVYGEGFRTTVLPARRAGATFHVASIRGAFHGAIAATTPSGLWTFSMNSVSLSTSTS